MPNITITRRAAEHIASALIKRGSGIGVRLGVKAAGCTGLSYTMEFADAVNEEDEVFEDFGARVLVDILSLPHLDGTELDFTREGLSEGFKFNNPNALSQCGCGESFNT
jgi:iron-sulfur cluster assembly protein